MVFVINTLLAKYGADLWKIWDIVCRNTNYAYMIFFHYHSLIQCRKTLSIFFR